MTTQTHGKRILVIGAAGMVGHKVWQTLRARYSDVFATIRKERSAYEWHPLFASAPKERLIDGINLLEPDRVLPVLDEVRPQFIFNGVGLTFRRESSGSATTNIRLNALLPHVLNDWCVKNNSQLISLSTDCVFSGRTGAYTEDSPADAQDVYGRSKALGEVESDRALIIRTSVVGREIENHTELLEWFLNQRGKRILGFAQAIFSGVSTVYLANLVADLIEKYPRMHGIYQLASQPISKYDLLRKLREHFNVDVDIVEDHAKVVKKDLVGTKFERSTGFKAPSWDQMINDLKADPTPYGRRSV